MRRALIAVATILASCAPQDHEHPNALPQSSDDTRRGLLAAPDASEDGALDPSDSRPDTAPPAASERPTGPRVSDAGGRAQPSTAPSPCEARRPIDLAVGVDRRVAGSALPSCPAWVERGGRADRLYVGCLSGVARERVILAVAVEGGVAAIGTRCGALDEGASSRAVRVVPPGAFALEYGLPDESGSLRIVTTPAAADARIEAPSPFVALSTGGLDGGFAPCGAPGTVAAQRVFAWPERAPQRVRVTAVGEIAASVLLASGADSATCTAGVGEQLVPPDALFTVIGIASRREARGAALLRVELTARGAR